MVKLKRLWASNNAIKKAAPITHCPLINHSMSPRDHAQVEISFAALDLLDLSKNGLFEVYFSCHDMPWFRASSNVEAHDDYSIMSVQIPDLQGCPNLKELDCSRNKIRGVGSLTSVPLCLLQYPCV